MLWDASESGALLEVNGWLPIGALIQMCFDDGSTSSLVSVVRFSFGDDFVRRYGVSCVQGCLPVERLMTDSYSPGDSLDARNVRWPSVRSDIRRIYRSLAMKMHPDVGGSDERFRTLHREYLDAMAVASR